MCKKYLNAMVLIITTVLKSVQRKWYEVVSQFTVKILVFSLAKAPTLQKQ